MRWTTLDRRKLKQRIKAVLVFLVLLLMWMLLIWKKNTLEADIVQLAKFVRIPAPQALVLPHKIAEKQMKIVPETITDKINVEFDVESGLIQASEYYGLNACIDFGKSKLIAGIGKGLGKSMVVNLQQRLKIENNLSARYGICYSKGGAFLDYTPHPAFDLSLGAYSIGRMTYEMQARFQLSEKTKIIARIRKDSKLSNNSLSFAIGVSYKLINQDFYF